MTKRAVLEDPGLHPRLKLATSWASFMFLYIYVDYFHLYMPGSIGEIVQGRVFLFEIDQSYILVAFLSVALPALMIVLSVGLPARLSRLSNIVVAIVYVPYTLFNLLGVAWLHMYIAAVIEVAILVWVIGCAWAWPRIDSQTN